MGRGPNSPYAANTSCSARVAANPLRLDSPDIVKQHAQALYQQVVVQKLMPMNNATQITDAERALIGRWFEAGAPTAP